MSRKNIEKSLARNFNRTLCLEVAYYDNSAEKVIENAYMNYIYADYIPTYEKVEKLQELLVNNVQKYPFIITTESKYTMKFMLSTDDEWKRRDCEIVQTKTVIDRLGRLLDRKSELELIAIASEAKGIVESYKMRNYRLQGEERAVERFWSAVFDKIDAITEGLHKTTKIKVFENYLINLNSFHQDSFEDAMENIRYYNGLIQETQLKGVLNPLVTEEMQFDEEKFQALRTLMTKA